MNLMMDKMGAVYSVFVFRIILGMLVLCGCSRQGESLVSIHPQESEIVYFNSFEHRNDSLSMGGYEDGVVEEAEAAPGCGEQALLVAGGCLQPAARFKVTASDDGVYCLSFWARLTDFNQTGHILFSGSRQKGQSITIADTHWVYYVSEPLQSDVCGDTLFIDCHGGSLISASFWLDCLMVEMISDHQD